MPLIYGEGRNAFRRLQEEVIKRSQDQSIFAWQKTFEGNVNDSFPWEMALSVLAYSPAKFRGCGNIIFDHNSSLTGKPYAVTNSGIEMEVSVHGSDAYTDGHTVEHSARHSRHKRLYILTLNCKRFDPGSTSRYATTNDYENLPNIQIPLIPRPSQPGFSIYARMRERGLYMHRLRLTPMTEARIYLVAWDTGDLLRPYPSRCGPLS